MKIPTLGSPEIWPRLAPRLAKYLQPKLGKAYKATQRKHTDIVDKMQSYAKIIAASQP